MKIKVLLFSLFLILNFNAYGQDLTKLKSNKQLSVKTTSWIENKLDLASSPYQITMKTLGEKSNKRLSLGVNVGTFYSGRVASNIQVNMRFGKERFLDFGKEQKWRLFYGLDYLISAGASINSSWAVGNLSGGIAPFAGLQYRINERLVVFTETNYELSVSAFVSNRRGSQASLRNDFNPLGSIWLGFELFRPKKR